MYRVSVFWYLVFVSDFIYFIGWLSCGVWNGIEEENLGI